MTSCRNHPHDPSKTWGLGAVIAEAFLSYPSELRGQGLKGSRALFEALEDSGYRGMGPWGPCPWLSQRIQMRGPCFCARQERIADWCGYQLELLSISLKVQKVQKLPQRASGQLRYACLISFAPARFVCDVVHLKGKLSFTGIVDVHVAHNSTTQA